MRPNHTLLAFLCSLLFSPLVLSASNPTSFCKCTCGSNSTIIPLDISSVRTNTYSLRSLSSVALSQDRLVSEKWRREEAPSEDPETQGSTKDGEDDDKGDTVNGGEGNEGSDRGKEKEKGKEYRKKTCNDCNRQYCLEQHLHICESKSIEEIFTTCFQRDSRKDEAVVFIFIFATAALLGWAAVKPWVGRFISNAKERSAYRPIDTGVTEET